MIFDVPALTDQDDNVIGLVSQLHDEVAWRTRAPRQWTGTLRRALTARQAQASNSIEGYDAAVAAVAALLDGETPDDPVEAETAAAIQSYRQMMDYLQNRADDDQRLGVEALQAAHWLLMAYDPDKRRGLFRKGDVYVGGAQGIAYTGPDDHLVDGLIGELLASIENPDVSPYVDAALAHLNLVMIHPWSDGNGRMSRALQTFILGRRLGFTPVFVSIEEYLGANTLAYYDALQRTGGPTWDPVRSALPFVRFCLTAHYRQAERVRREADLVEDIYSICDKAVRDARIDVRVTDSVVAAAHGDRVTRSSHVANVLRSTGDGISDMSASRDLAKLVDAGLFDRQGTRGAAVYVLGDELASTVSELRADHLPPGPIPDPYDSAE